MTSTGVRVGVAGVLALLLAGCQPLFQERVLVQASGVRSWPGGTSYPAGLVAEGATGGVVVPVVVPDTAAAGV